MTEPRHGMLLVEAIEACCDRDNLGTTAKKMRRT